MSILRLKDENGNWQDVPAIIGPQGEPGKDGVTGADGKSAYQIWLDAGNTGTEADFLASLVGPQGPEGKPGEDGVTPDLSGVVKFVNNIGPDDNGNVEIEYEGFKVYRVKDGVSNSQYSSSRYSYILTDECLSTIQTMIANYLEGERNGVLVIDTDNILYLSDNLCFIIDESKSTSSKIVFQSLITPKDKLSVSSNATTGISALREAFYGMDVNWENDTIGTYTCYKSTTNVSGGSFVTSTTVTSANLTITGLHTYNKLPQSSVEPTDNKDLVNKSYVDSVAGGIKVINNSYRETILNQNNSSVLTWFSLCDYGGSGLYIVGESNLIFELPNGTQITLYVGSVIYIYNKGSGYVNDFGNQREFRIIGNYPYTATLSGNYYKAISKLNYLAQDNTTAYTPTSDYHPATKQYVDNLVGDIESLLSEV